MRGDRRRGRALRGSTFPTTRQFPRYCVAQVLACWAADLLAVAGVVSVGLFLMADRFRQLLAVPDTIAVIGLGYSLWSTAGGSITSPVAPGAALAATPSPPSG